MIKLKELKHAVHDNTLRARSVEAIVQSAKFERLWDDSNKTDKYKAELAIWQGSKPKLIEWMKEHDSLELGERPVSYLKARAKKMRIRNYSRLSKPELIGAINKREKEDESE